LWPSRVNSTPGRPSRSLDGSQVTARFANPASGQVFGWYAVRELREKRWGEHSEVH
jgi:hypothetical protein